MKPYLLVRYGKKEFKSSYTAILLEHRLTLDNEKNLKSIERFLKQCYDTDDGDFVNSDLVIKKNISMKK